MRRKQAVLLTLIILTIGNTVFASPFEYRTYKNWTYIWHKHNESSYQHSYQQKYGGIEEYTLPDYTRVDLLTDKYAIEFDFANKWYEAIGQSLHYAVMTGKQPKIVLILDKKYETEQMRYVERTKNIGKVYNIEVEYITEEFLDLDREGHCPFKDCKCNKNP